MSELESVVVVATRSPEPLSKIGGSVTLIDAAAIQESQAVDVADLLVQTPGISMFRAGGIGQSTSVFIRGAASDQTVVIIDGVQLNDPSVTSGGFDFQHLMMGDISRIEVLRGAQSTLYGSQAMGGVINIMTAEPVGALSGGLSSEAGSYGTGQAIAHFGGKSDSLLWRMSTDYYASRGFPCFDKALGGKRDCATQIEGGSGQLRYEFTPEAQLDIRAYFTHSKTDFDGYDTPTYTFGDDSEYGYNQQLLAYAGLTLRSTDYALVNRIAVQYTGSHTRTYDPNAIVNFGSPSNETFYGTGRNIREEYQGTWTPNFRTNLVFGVQHETSTINTDSPAYDFGGPAPIKDQVSLVSGYAQLQRELMSGVTLTAGERYDRHNVYGGHATGQMAVAWVLDDRSTIVRASVGQGFKAPALYQLYSPYGNLGLQPETSTTWDAGIERHLLNNRLMLSATYFQSASHELINFFSCPSSSSNPLCAVAGGYYANIGQTAARGVEWQGEFKANSRITIASNYTYTYTADQSADAAVHDAQLPRRPQHAANASVNYQWDRRWNATVAVRYAGPSFEDSANTVRLGGYTLINLRASYTISDHLELYARLENAGDKQYEMAYQYGTPGRSGYLGFRAHF